MNKKREGYDESLDVTIPLWHPSRHEESNDRHGLLSDGYPSNGIKVRSSTK